MVTNLLKKQAVRSAFVLINFCASFEMYSNIMLNLYFYYFNLYLFMNFSNYITIIHHRSLIYICTVIHKLIELKSLVFEKFDI